MDVGAIIGSGLDLVGNIFNAKSSRKAAKYNADLEYKAAQEQMNFSREQQIAANNFNLDMWRRENEYNTPANQMQRLKDAGLNPSLMYSQGTTGNSSSAPEFQTIQPDASAFRTGANKVPFLLPSLSNSINTMLSTMLAANQVEKTRSENKLLGAQTEYYQSLAEKALSDANRRDDYWNTYFRDKQQSYYLRGGDLLEHDAKRIHDSIMKIHDIRPELLEAQKDMYKGFRTRSISDAALNRIRGGRETAMEQWYKSYKQEIDNRNNRYKKTQRFWDDNLGPARPLLEKLGDSSLSILSSILRNYFSLGSKGIKAVMDEVLESDFKTKASQSWQKQPKYNIK